MNADTPGPTVVTGFPLYAKAITPSNTDNLTNNASPAVEQSQFVFVGVGGNVKVIPAGNADSDTVTFTIPTGSFVPVRCRRVFATGTTASSLVGVF